MQIGLIGGIGPAATDYYYQNIIRAFEDKQKQLELTMVHTGSPTLLKNLAANNVDEQVAIYERLTNRLVAAGAGCVVITSIAGHFCIGPFKEISPLPVIDMIEETEKAVRKLGYEKIGIMGTKTVMENRFYGGIRSAEVIPPSGEMLDLVHKAYIEMAASGRATARQREIFATAYNTFVDDEGVDAIMLGGTDLALIYREGRPGTPIIDCASIHCRAVVERVLG
ncbi:MAG: aspartate/glutamate racemase family protein [Pseudomonadota bacterium]